MKKMLMVTSGQSFRQILGSALLVVAGVLFAVGFSMSGPKAHAQGAAGAPDFEGTADPEKCTICHVPPGNPGNAQTLTIGCSAVQAHMRNHPGDCMGPCPCQPTPSTNP